MNIASLKQNSQTLKELAKEFDSGKIQTTNQIKQILSAIKKELS